MKRWWGIRHIRFWWLRGKLYRFLDECHEVGIGFAGPHPRDLEYLDAVWRGEA